MPRLILSVRLYGCLLGLAFAAVTTITAAPHAWEEVSGTKALEHVQQLVDLGPRPAGSEALEKSRAYIEKQLSVFGWTVSRQSFSAATPRGQ